jgi:hypothetical protein
MQATTLAEPPQRMSNLVDATVDNTERFQMLRYEMALAF